MNRLRRPLSIKTEGILLVVTVFPFFCGLVWIYLDRDFWYDEIFTLRQFLLVSFSKLLTDYHVPNNHIFFNLLSRLFLVLTDDLGPISGLSASGLLEHPARLRVLMFLFTAVTLVYLYRICKKCFDRPTAWLALLLLVTTVPFFHFTMWIRGYGLSMTLILISVYHLVCYQESRERRHAVIFMIVCALLFYTVPLNAYYLVTVGIFHGGFGLIPVLRTRSEGRAAWNLFWKEGGWVVGCLAGAGVLSFLLYLPTIGSVIGNRFTKGYGQWNSHVLVHLFPEIMKEFLSYRYALLPLMVIGLYLFVVEYFKQTKVNPFRHFLFWNTVLVLPFIISFVRGDRPPDRAFVNLCPAFAIVSAVTLRSAMSVISKFRVRWATVWSLLFIYCYGTLGFELSQVQSRFQTRDGGIMEQRNVFFNYGPMIFSPRRLLNDYRPWYDPGGTPVYAFNYDGEALPVYLRHMKIEYQDLKYLEWWKPGPAGRADTITGRPALFQKVFRELFPGMHCRELIPDAGFHRIVRCGKAGSL